MKTGQTITAEVHQFWVALVLAAMLSAAHAASQLTVGISAGFPGASVTLPGQFASDASAVALQYDIIFDDGALAASGVTAGDALQDHNIFFRQLGNGTNRVLVYSTSNAPLSNGVLANLYFTIATNAPVGTTSVTFTNGLLANAHGDTVAPVSVVPGNITITAGPARLGAVAVGVGSLVQFQVDGSFNGQYLIQASADLAGWTPISTNVAVNGVIQLRDADSTTYPRRFYRALVLP